MGRERGTSTGDKAEMLEVVGQNYLKAKNYMSFKK